jgi:uncharacterized protein (DUF4415 family)
MNKEHGRSATIKAVEKGTDWGRLPSLPDSQVRFTDDAPATSAHDWVDAVAHHGLPVPPRKTQIALRVDDEVLAWFKAQVKG